MFIYSPGTGDMPLTVSRSLLQYFSMLTHKEGKAVAMAERGDHSGQPLGKAYNPLRRAEEAASVTCRGDLRTYHRFRPARFYGGIATADCVGCCLQCLFCWSWNQVTNPEHYGQWCSPRQVAEQLIHIARKRGFRRVRISGNEPTLGRRHLIKVLELIPHDVLFILETNGILIGSDQTYAEDLAAFDNLYVRVSIKGCTSGQFSAVTGALPMGFDLQIQAVENLVRAGVKVHPAVMVSFSTHDEIGELRNRLGKIRREFRDMEIEELVMYGDVEKRLKQAEIFHGPAYAPDKIPPEQV